MYCFVRRMEFGARVTKLAISNGIIQFNGRFPRVRTQCSQHEEVKYLLYLCIIVSNTKQDFFTSK